MSYVSATETFTDNNNNGAGFRYLRMWDDGMKHYFIVVYTKIIPTLTTPIKIVI